jgi:hypothetical protein
VQGMAITILPQREEGYISLTDMVKHFEGRSALIEQWLKNKDTVLFLGVWEQINNPDFKSLEFEGIKNEAGRNSFYLSAKKWIERTNAKGLISSTGRYGGTYAHKDIAFEFAMWISPEFKLCLIMEFQRLKDEESLKRVIQCFCVFIFTKILIQETVNDEVYFYKVINFMKITLIVSFVFLFIQMAVGVKFSLTSHIRPNVIIGNAIRYPSFFADPQHYSQYLSVMSFLCLFVPPHSSAKKRYIDFILIFGLMNISNYLAIVLFIMILHY